MNTSEKKLEFARPPVDEVVLSVLFEPLNGLLAPPSWRNLAGI